MQSLVRYFRFRSWKDLIFLFVVLLIWFVVRRFVMPAPLSDYDKWKRRPQLGQSALVEGVEGRTGLPPCLFVVPPNAVDQPVDSGSIGDCLLLLPDGKKLDLFEDALEGSFLPIKTDLFVADSVPLAFTRTYLPLDDWSRSNHLYIKDVYDPNLYGDRFPYTYAVWQLPDAQKMRFGRTSSGTGYADAVFEHRAPTPVFAGSRIKWNGYGWDLTIDNGFTYLSPEAYGVKRAKQGSLVGIFDSEGREIRISRYPNGDISEIRSPGAQWIRFRYDNGRVVEAKGNSGNVVGYRYDSSDRLASVQYPNGKLTKYSYDSGNRVTRVEDTADELILENSYDTDGNLARQSMNGKLLYTLSYSIDEKSKTMTTSVRDAQGKLSKINIQLGDSVLYSVTN